MTREDKRKAILAGALTVFARDGYTRASVDAIARAAEVSTRTIYNHFADKAVLFQAVIQESAARAAEAQLAVIDRHLRKVTDLEADLVDFGREFTAPVGDGHAEHFALVRQINAEAGHIPQAAIEAWQETGPHRVRREVAAHLRRWTEQGLLRAENPDRAAVHLLLLISVSDPSYQGTVPTEEEINETVSSGVRAFLHGYLR
ncbi:TetR/AcrR family transcriptional regulator [Nonomuraea rubra]|uniref:AcrR family transcriptional regulator n=1 Tax=Nonomuraea rubra TaxID=46180 RepID=A0A7X0NUL0_9ACTN|nr:TetR/AcrR family transcriptional regulator [Nonomuraea rubra]MBB6549933.1 AcrR family transcriptional regulator [Nonomuraea rubra]